MNSTQTPTSSQPYYFFHGIKCLKRKKRLPIFLSYLFLQKKPNFVSSYINIFIIQICPYYIYLLFIKAALRESEVVHSYLVGSSFLYCTMCGCAMLLLSHTIPSAVFGAKCRSKLFFFPFPSFVTWLSKST